MICCMAMYISMTCLAPPACSSSLQAMIQPGFSCENFDNLVDELSEHHRETLLAISFTSGVIFVNSGSFTRDTGFARPALDCTTMPSVANGLSNLSGYLGTGREYLPDLASRMMSSLEFGGVHQRG